MKLHLLKVIFQLFDHQRGPKGKYEIPVPIINHHKIH
jgi:hypothetical protein